MSANYLQESANCTSASSAAPIIERSVQEAISSTVIPKFTQATQNLIDTLSREIQQEILGVRKEIVSEQSILLSDLIEEVRQLRQQIGSNSLPSQSPLYTDRQYQERQPPQIPVRPATPIAAYEDTLLKLLSSPDAANEVARYVSQAPPYRIQQIFSGYEGKPAITQVCLSHFLIRS